MELLIEDLRSLVGSYVLELLVKQKEIEQLKKQIEELTPGPSKIHPLKSQSPDVIIEKA